MVNNQTDISKQVMDNIAVYREQCSKVQREIVQTSPVNMAAVRSANTALQLALQSEDIAKCADELLKHKKKTVLRLAHSLLRLSKEHLEQALLAPRAPTWDSAQVAFRIQEIACRFVIPDHNAQEEVYDVVRGLTEYEPQRDEQRELLDDIAAYINKQHSPHRTALRLQANVEDTTDPEQLNEYRRQFEQLQC